MKTEQIVMCVVALALGMLVANMLTNVCGCKTNVEGLRFLGDPLQNTPGSGVLQRQIDVVNSSACGGDASIDGCPLSGPLTDQIRNSIGNMCGMDASDVNTAQPLFAAACRPPPPPFSCSDDCQTPVGDEKECTYTGSTPGGNDNCRGCSECPVFPVPGGDLECPTNMSRVPAPGGMCP